MGISLQALAAEVACCDKILDARLLTQMSPSKRHYHFYHFSPRLPLQIATKCDNLRRVATAGNRGRIVLKPFTPNGFLGFSA